MSITSFINFLAYIYDVKASISISAKGCTLRLLKESTVYSSYEECVEDVLRYIFPTVHTFLLFLTDSEDFVQVLSEVPFDSELNMSEILERLFYDTSTN